MGHEDQGVSGETQRYRVVPRTLCFVLNGDDVLMLKGAPQKRLWANLYNGLGGHVERDEDVYAAAMREICEETGWKPKVVRELRLRGLVNVNAGDPRTGVMLFVFLAQTDQLETRASQEGSLQWISRSRLLEYDLVDDLPELLPRLFSLPREAPPLFGHYSYDQKDRLAVRFNPAHLPDVP
jgi:8-oxo-dGTP diphosphatase